MTSTNIKELEEKLQAVQQRIEEQRNRVSNVTQIALSMAAQMKVAYPSMDVDYDAIIKNACEIYDEICKRIEQDIIPTTQTNIDHLVDEGEDIAEALRKARHIEAMMGGGKKPKIALPN